MTIDLNEEFQPFRADPEAEAKETALGFLNWLIESHIRIHRYHQAHARYVKGIYEMLHQIIHQQQPVPQRPGVAGIDAAKIQRAAAFVMDPTTQVALRSLLRFFSRSG